MVRQLYAAKLINQYGYPKQRLAFEHPVNFGRQTKRADIVIFDKDRPDTPYIIVELKKSKLQDGKNQLRSYCNATGAPIGVWTNGEQISLITAAKTRITLKIFPTSPTRTKPSQISSRNASP